MSFMKEHGYYFDLLLNQLISGMWNSLHTITTSNCIGCQTQTFNTDHHDVCTAVSEHERLAQYFDDMWSSQDTSRILELVKDVIRIKMDLYLKYCEKERVTNSYSGVISTSPTTEPAEDYYAEIVPTTCDNLPTHSTTETCYTPSFTNTDTVSTDEYKYF